MRLALARTLFARYIYSGCSNPSVVGMQGDSAWNSLLPAKPSKEPLMHDWKVHMGVLPICLK